MLSDDYFKSKNPAELAWYLVTGEESNLPPCVALERWHLAYTAGFVEMLDTLCKATIGKSNSREALFSRSWLRAILLNSDAQKRIHSIASSWLKGRNPSKPRKPRMGKPLKQPMSDELKQKDIETDFKAASVEGKHVVMERAAVAKKLLENRGLRSQELDCYRETDFYRRQVEEMRRGFPGAVNGDGREAAIYRQVEKIWNKIEDNVNPSAEIHGEQFRYLLTADGQVPSKAEIRRKLIDAEFLLLAPD